jgi:hypothetical protein
VKSRGHDVIQTLHIIIALRSFLSGTKQAIARHHHTFIRVRHSSCTLTAARKLVTQFFCFDALNFQGRKSEFTFYPLLPCFVNNISFWNFSQLSPPLFVLVRATTTSLTWTGLGSNPVLRDKRSATNLLSH